MQPLVTRPWNVVDHLNDPKAIAGYLEAAFQENDRALTLAAIDDMFEAIKNNNLAEKIGLSYKDLTNPTFEAVLKVLDFLGIKLEVREYA